MPRGLQVSVVLSSVGLQGRETIRGRMEATWMDKGNHQPLSWKAQEKKLLLQRTSCVLTKSAGPYDLAWLLQTMDPNPVVYLPRSPSVSSARKGDKTGESTGASVPERIKRRG